MGGLCAEGCSLVTDVSTLSSPESVIVGVDKGWSMSRYTTRANVPVCLSEPA